MALPRCRWVIRWRWPGVWRRCFIRARAGGWAEAGVYRHEVLHGGGVMRYTAGIACLPNRFFLCPTLLSRSPLIQKSI